MSEIRFESSLSIDEIESNFKDISFFDGIISGLNEALACEKEHTKAKSSKVSSNNSQIKKS
ncbi:MAG: hypothetical protein LUG52_08285 [Clostridia bacterium]|nr:hypothetical protein [Clostridia bacterium]